MAGTLKANGRSGTSTGRSRFTAGTIASRIDGLNNLVLEGEARLRDQHLALLAGDKFAKHRERVEWLDIDKCPQVSDEALVHLLSLPNLERVDAKGTQITQAAAQAFVNGHPNRENLEFHLEVGREPLRAS